MTRVHEIKEEVIVPANHRPDGTVNYHVCYGTVNYKIRDKYEVHQLE